MNWYYVADGKQVGPVGEGELQELVNTGVIRADTLVWHEGLPEWKPYGQLNAAPPVSASINLETVRDRDYTVDIGGTISAAWATYKANFGSILGAALACFGILAVCGAIPFIGFIPQLFLQGPLLGGLFILVVRHIRGEGPPFSDLFSGFKNNYLNLMLTNFVSTLLSGLCLLPAVIVFIIGIILTGAIHHGSAPHWAALGIWLIPTLALVAVGVVVATYLTVSWMFALPLVADKHLPFWPAMQLSRHVVGKHWWGIFGLVFVSGLVSALGIIACGIGLLFTLPLAMVVLMHQYEKLFGDLQN